MKMENLNGVAIKDDTHCPEVGDLVIIQTKKGDYEIGQIGDLDHEMELKGGVYLMAYQLIDRRKDPNLQSL